MRKKPEDKAEERYSSYVAADRVERQRLFENTELLKEVKKLQVDFGLPLDPQGKVYPSGKQIADWYGWDEPIEVDKSGRKVIYGPKGQRRERLKKEIKALAKRFNIPNKFLSSLKNLVVANNYGYQLFSAGFPSIRFDKDRDGNLVQELIVTPETDLGNPIVLEFIRDWQKDQLDTLSCPQPIMRGRRLDWRPVWEWKKRHPDVTYKEIAPHLHRNSTNVRKALAALDKENLQQK